jgi:uncharacterized protein with PIN domain
MYKIPKEKDVQGAIRVVLEKNKEIDSQKLFLDMILRKLRKDNPHYKLSVERLKRISSQMPDVKIFVEKRRSNKEAKKCFICGGELEKLKVKGLLGEETLVGSKCKRCDFKMDKRYLAPKRYIFYTK